jgi:hygromycin-B 7''-O-kinase
VFLSSTKGEYVLRGCPHHERQFPHERFFAQQIHRRTTVPVPWPYRIDTSPEVFGWSYATMPRLPGLQIGHPDVRKTLSAEDRRGLARAMGEGLARLHELTWPHEGEYDLETDTIKPLDVSFGTWVTTRLHVALQRCLEASDATTDADVAWVEEQIAQGQAALDAPPEPTLVHHDYKENNAVAERVAGGWRVTGVFDLGEAYFGDGEEDLARSVAGYAAQNPELARQFMAAYRAGRPLRPGFAQRFPIYMLADRLIIWEYGQRHGIWFEPGVIFRDWASRYTSLSLF